MQQTQPTQHTSLTLSLLAAIVFTCLVCAACGSGSAPATQPAFQAQPSAEPSTAWPAVLPADAPQPWEQAGRASHHAAGLLESSEFVLGIDVYNQGGDTLAFESGLRLAGGLPDSGEVSFAIYRVALAGDPPAIVTADINPRMRPDGQRSSYWLGLSNYSRETWEWHGPFTDAQVRLQPDDPAADYNSTIGNHFVAVVAYDGAMADIVGVGAQPRDTGDSTPPPAPAGLTANGASGAIKVSWTHVVDAGLAGYRIYYSPIAFTAVDEPAVRAVNHIEGLNEHLLVTAIPQHIRITAMDFSGNESSLSDEVLGAPLNGEPVPVALHVNHLEVLRGSPAGLTAVIPGAPAVTYDFDVDGDGIFEVTGSASNQAPVDTSAPGIIRPRVRVTGGTMEACGSVSLLVSANSRPVAEATAAPASGEVTLNVDLTGTGTDYDGSIDQYAWDFDGDGTYDYTDAANPNPPTQPYAAAGLYNAKFRVMDDQGAIDVDTVAIYAYDPVVPPVNIPPTAALASDRPRAYMNQYDGVDVNFDAGASSDPEGGALNFEFDPEGDGTFVDNGATATYQHTYTKPGVYQPRVRVTDPDSAAGYASLALSVYQFDGNHVVTNGDTGRYSSVCVVGGNPAIASYDAGNTRVEYYFSNNAQGTDWNAGIIIDGSTTNAGEYCRLDTNGNYPAVVYFDDTNNEIRFCKASNYIGTAFATPYTVVSSFTGTVSLDWLDAGGRAGIAYHHNGNLMFIRALAADGSTWNPPITLDPGPNTGLYPSLAIVDGNPAVSYYDDNNDDLMYVRATDFQGTAWGTPVVVDDSLSAGLYSSLAVVDGFPAISYMAEVSERLWYVRATDATGSAWDAPVQVDSSMHVGYYSNLAVLDGRPVICYTDEPPTTYLRMVHALDATGNTWDTPFYADGDGSRGEYCTMVILPNGLPGIAYRYYYLADLMFATPKLY